MSDLCYFGKTRLRVCVLFLDPMQLSQTQRQKWVNANRWSICTVDMYIFRKYVTDKRTFPCHNFQELHNNREGRGFLFGNDLHDCE